MSTVLPARRTARLTEARPLVFAVRLTLLGFCFVVAALDAQPRRTVAGALIVAVATGIGYLPVRSSLLRRLLPTVEACVAAVAVVAPPADRLSLLPYLLAPAFAAGLMHGMLPAVNTAGMATVVLLLGHLLADNPTSLQSFAADTSQWVLLALAVGLLAAWVRRLATATTSDADRSYEAAYELLSQLRTVSRQLSGGLDSVSLAHGLLQSLREPLPYTRGGVFVQVDGGGLAPLALEGADFVDWDTTLDAETPLGVSWQTRTGSAGVGSLGRTPGGLDGPTVWHAVLPLRMGDRMLGLVALESVQPVAPAQLSAATTLADHASLRLETALLFGEVRSIATSEERRRLAREIHDGIAQELASLGYAIDDLVAEADSATSADVLRTLRRDVTRMVGELRLSIFDLRSEVQAQTGLGAALSNYVRTISAGASFSVHVILDETPARLPITVEAELLRIAQEAVTNARKHAGARHLWVSCQVDPPFAHLRIEDDGRGLGKPRHDSFGLEVMRERAERIGASLLIGHREPHGTFIDVRLGERRSRPRDATVSAGRQDAEHQAAEHHEEGHHDGRERAAR